MALLEKAKKGLGSFCYRFRWIIIVLFAALFIGVSIGQGFLGIAFSEREHNPITMVFPMDTVIVVYNNNDEEVVGEIIAYLEADDSIREVHAFANTVIGVRLDAISLAAHLGLPDEALPLIEMVLAGQGVSAMSMYDFVMTAAQSDVLPPEIVQLMAAQVPMLSAAREQFVGTYYSRMIVTLGYWINSQEILVFYENFVLTLDNIFEHDFFLVGESAMSYELSRTFELEYILISLLLALALYVVLAISYRKFLLPLLLISVVQCAMFVMMAVIAMTAVPLHFLALLIVQSVIKGASLEWGVLLTNNYIEARKTKLRRPALQDAILRSGRVTLASALIMTVVTFSLGLVMSGAVASIMLGMGMASGAAAVLTMVVLPSILVVFDRFVVKRPKKSAHGRLEPANVSID